MIGTKKSRIALQLSLYLDDRLDSAQREQVASRIARDPELRREYEHLRRMRDLLSARESIPANPFLPEHIMNRIREDNREPDAYLPVPRRFMPAAAGAIAVVVIALLALAWIQREQILRYIGNTGEEMQHAYEDTILKGWIMPLFQRTDRDQVLQYAMFGTLPLDDSDGTVLRIDESADRGYRLELAGSTARTGPPATINELYREIRPTAVQRKIFDTLFLYAQRQIEAAVLMNEAKEIAIDPAISKYNQVILSGIAASLEPDQQERFESFLEKRNTPYTFVSHRHTEVPPQPPTPPAKLMERFRTMRVPEAFVVLTEDSFTVTQLHLNMDSLRRLMKIVEGRMPRIEMRVQDLARTYARVSRESGNDRTNGDGTDGDRRDVSRTEGFRIGTPAPPQLPRGVSVGPVLISEVAHGIAISIDAGAEFMQDLEDDFDELRREISVFRRESEQHRENLSPRVRVRQRAQVSPESGQYEWRTLIPESKFQHIDSLLRAAGVEKLLKQKEIQQLREELMREQLRRDGEIEQPRIEVITTDPPPVPALPEPRQEPPRREVPVTKDTVIQI